jgi:hypothetical protein
MYQGSKRFENFLPFKWKAMVNIIKGTLKVASEVLGLWLIYAVCASFGELSINALLFRGSCSSLKGWTDFWKPKVLKVSCMHYVMTPTCKAVQNLVVELLLTSPFQATIWGCISICVGKVFLLQDVIAQIERSFAFLLGIFPCSRIL